MCIRDRGYINVSEGGFLPDLNEPSGFVTDTTLDSAAPNANLYNSGTISVGRQDTVPVHLNVHPPLCQLI